MDVVLAKIESIKKCISRIIEEYNNDSNNLNDFTKQDSIILNIQRACELSIDISNYIISKFNFQTPKSSREAFDILHEKKVIDDKIKDKMKKMIGFRNIAVHDYKRIDIKIIESIIKNNLKDLEQFNLQVIDYLKNKANDSK